jgi:glycerol-3-phosphate dehydrogenase (NAD(P)+)
VRAGLDTRLWVRSPELASAIAERRENTAYLPGIELPAGLRATASLADADRGRGGAADRRAVRVLPALYRQVSGIAPKSALVVSATKGLESGHAAADERGGGGRSARPAARP